MIRAAARWVLIWLLFLFVVCAFLYFSLAAVTFRHGLSEIEGVTRFERANLYMLYACFFSINSAAAAVILGYFPRLRA